MANKEDILTQIIHDQRHEKSVRTFLKGFQLNEEQLYMPNANLYCKALVLCNNKVVSDKDKKYLKHFMRFWQFKNGCVTKKNKKRVLGIINYYEQQKQNANNKLLRHKLRPNSIKQ